MPNFAGDNSVPEPTDKVAGRKSSQNEPNTLSSRVLFETETETGSSSKSSLDVLFPKPEGKSSERQDFGEEVPVKQPTSTIKPNPSEIKSVEDRAYQNVNAHGKNLPEYEKLYPDRYPPNTSDVSTNPAIRIQDQLREKARADQYGTVRGKQAAVLERAQDVLPAEVAGKTDIDRAEAKSLEKRREEQSQRHSDIVKPRVQDPAQMDKENVATRDGGTPKRAEAEIGPKDIGSSVGETVAHDVQRRNDAAYSSRAENANQDASVQDPQRIASIDGSLNSSGVSHLRGKVTQGQVTEHKNEQYTPVGDGRVPGNYRAIPGSKVEPGLPTQGAMKAEQGADTVANKTGGNSLAGGSHQGAAKIEPGKVPPNAVKGADGKYYVPGQAHNLDGSPIANQRTIDGVTSANAFVETPEGSRVKGQEVREPVTKGIEGTTRPGKLHDFTSEPHKGNTDVEGKAGAKLDVDFRPDGKGKRIGLDGKEIIGLDGKSSPLYPNQKGKRITRFVDQGKKIAPGKGPGGKSKIDPKADLDPKERAQIDKIIKETDRIFFGEKKTKVKGKAGSSIDSKAGKKGAKGDVNTGTGGKSGAKGDVRSGVNSTKVSKGDTTSNTSVKGDTAKGTGGKRFGLPDYAPFPGLKLPEFKIKLPGRKGKVQDSTVKGTDATTKAGKVKTGGRRVFDGIKSGVRVSGEGRSVTEKGTEKTTSKIEAKSDRRPVMGDSAAVKVGKDAGVVKTSSDKGGVKSPTEKPTVKASGDTATVKTAGDTATVKTGGDTATVKTGSGKGGYDTATVKTNTGKKSGDAAPVKTGSGKKIGDSKTVKTDSGKATKKGDLISSKKGPEKNNEGKKAKNQKFGLKESKDAYNGKLPSIKMSYKADTGKVRSFTPEGKVEQSQVKSTKSSDQAAGKKLTAESKPGKVGEVAAKGKMVEEVGKQVQRDLRPVNTAKAGIANTEAMTPRSMRDLNASNLTAEVDSRTGKTSKAELDGVKSKLDTDKGKFTVEGKDGKLILKDLANAGGFKGGFSRRVGRLFDGARVVDGAHIVSLQIGMQQAKKSSIRDVLSGLNFGKAKKGFVPEISESGSYKVTRNQSSAQLKAFGSSARHTAINFAMEPSEDLLSTITDAEMESESSSEDLDDRKNIYRKQNQGGEDTRKPYIVQVGDTVESIAVIELNDESLAPLLFKLNEPLFKDMYNVYKQEHVKTLPTGTMILLPNKADIEKFKEQ